jgi:hypothetical protein
MFRPERCAGTSQRNSQPFRVGRCANADVLQPHLKLIDNGYLPGERPVSVPARSGQDIQLVYEAGGILTTKVKDAGRLRDGL